jgi:hypothetical protein
MVHWCQDETNALVAFLSGFPLLWQWLKAKLRRRVRR